MKSFYSGVCVHFLSTFGLQPFLQTEKRKGPESLLFIELVKQFKNYVSHINLNVVNVIGTQKMWSDTYHAYKTRQAIEGDRIKSKHKSHRYITNTTNREYRSCANKNSDHAEMKSTRFRISILRFYHFFYDNHTMSFICTSKLSIWIECFLK